MKPVAPPRTSRSVFLLRGLAVLAAFLVLVGLGTWQLQRKAWKDGLIATLTERLAAPPAPLPDPSKWLQLSHEDFEFRRVVFPAEYLNDREALVYSVGSSLRAGEPTGPGYNVFAPARLLNGAIVMVNRGFVPGALRDPATRADGQIAGTVNVIGVIRWPDPPSMVTPAADPGRNLWFARDPTAIAAAKGLEAAPFYIEQEQPVPAGGRPQPARLQPNLPNNHLQYVITWYGLAAALLLVFIAWAVGRRRGDRSEAGLIANPPPKTSGS
ncbi:MAG: SURF1 family protein [Rhodoplanes sp.]